MPGYVVSGPPFVDGAKKGDFVSLEGALLGLIASMGPVTGYDLTKMFRLSMSHYWHARHGQIYPTLEKLKRRGFVTYRKLIQRERPNKKLYTITDKGRAELLRWLRAPLRPLQMKHEALLKCRFYANLRPSEAISRMADERAQYEQLLSQYLTLEKQFFGTQKDYTDADAMFAYFTLKRGIMFLEESMRWCDWAASEVQRFNKPGRRTSVKRGARRLASTRR